MNILRSALLFYVLLTVALGARRYPEPKTKSAPRPKPPKLNTDNLPGLQDILADLGLTRFLKNFVKMGVTETRLLIRLTAMDFRMMALDWDGITEDEIVKLKDEIASLYNKALVVEEEIDVKSEERDKLTYGRVFIDNAVQSFDFILGSFGGPPPIGRFKMTVSKTQFGCDDDLNTDYSGTILVTLRGNCTFLTKATNAMKNNATAVVIVNTEDRLESPASGLGIDKNVTDRMVLALDKFPVLSFTNTSWSKIQFAMNFSSLSSVFASMVPLKCKSGGTCDPVSTEEKKLQSEVSSGTLRLRLRDTTSSTSSSSKKGAAEEVRSFDFLTSNFGSLLPTQQPVRVLLAEPVDACSELQVPTHIVDIARKATAAGGLHITPADYYAGAAVVVHRGNCRFDHKALHVQAAGARVMVVVDVQDNALQRVGGMTPEVGFVGIPSVIITAPGGQYLQSVLQSTVSVPSSSSSSSSSRKDKKEDRKNTAQEETDSKHSPTIAVTSNVHAEFVPAPDSSVADRWIDLAFTQWSESDEDRLLQLEGLSQKYSQPQHQQHQVSQQSNEIVAWLQRRMDEITGAKRKPIATDEL